MDKLLGDLDEAEEEVEDLRRDLDQAEQELETERQAKTGTYYYHQQQKQQHEQLDFPSKTWSRATAAP